MTIPAWKSGFTYCEIAPYFAKCRGVIEVPLKPPVRLASWGPRNSVYGAEWHHVIGGTSRIDHPSNLVLVCRDVHSWLTAHTLAGRVLCCKAMKDDGRLDWDALSEISGKRFPSVLETDNYRECCEPFPLIERFRRELIS